MVGRCDENMPGAYLFALCRVTCRHRAKTIEEPGQVALMRADVQRDEHGRVQSFRQCCNNRADSIHPADRGSDRDDSHWGSHCVSFPGNTSETDNSSSQTAALDQSYHDDATNLMRLSR